MKPSPHQILQELATLKALIDQLPQVDPFGAPYRAQVEAQIDVLEGEYDYPLIYLKYNVQGHSEQSPKNMRLVEALYANDWKNGEIDVPPSSDWLEVIEAAKRKWWYRRERKLDYKPGFEP